MAINDLVDESLNNSKDLGMIFEEINLANTTVVINEENVVKMVSDVITDKIK